MIRLITVFFLFVFVADISGQDRFADVILDAFYSGANPEFNDFYGNNGTTDGCKLSIVSPRVCLGDSDSIVSLPMDSYLTIGFTDNLIFDAPGQDDLFVEEIGGGQEFGELYVSPNGIDFTYLDILNGAQVNSFDLADYPYDDYIKAVKIVGTDFGGCTPGLDISRVYGIEGANCPCSAALIPFPEDVCEQDSLLDLSVFVTDSLAGEWAGPGVSNNVLHLLGIAEAIDIFFVINVDHPICPRDSISYPIQLADCDCNGVIGGNSVIDECGVCLDPIDPEYNLSCMDCAGIPNGSSVIDSCGLCLESTNPAYNMSCRDCFGEINGPGVIDLCGDCRYLSDPEINSACPERLSYYLPNVVSFNQENLSFSILANDESIAVVKAFEIYDRWGNLVYSIYDQSLREINRWWDGRYMDKGVVTGVYSYRLCMTIPELGDEQSYGTFTVIN